MPLKADFSAALKIDGNYSAKKNAKSA